MAIDTRVTGVEFNYTSDEYEEPYPQYEFGRGKKFMSNFQGEGIYGKPVSGTTHLPDPDLISSNP